MARQLPTPPADAEPDIDLVELVWLLWRRRWLLFGFLLLGASLSGLAAALLPPVYVAEALVLIEPRPAPTAREVVDTSGLDRDSTTVDSQVQVLRSRSLAERVIARLDLADDPELVPAAAAAVTSDAMAAVVEAFLARLRVVRRGKSRVIAVAYRSGDAEKAARVANAVAETYVAEQLAAKFELSQRATNWLNERLERAERQLIEAERRLADFRKRSGGNNSDFLAEAPAQLAALERAHIVAKAERAALEAKLARLRRAIERGDAMDGAFPEGGGRLLGELRAMRAQLARREAELRGLYGRRHPEIVKLRREKAELERQIAREQGNLLAGIEAEVEEARVRQRSLARELERLRRAVHDAARARQRERELERGVERARRLYEAFLARVESASGREEIELSDARVISAAVPPLAPAFPDPRVFLSIGIAASLGLGLASVYLLERRDRGFRSTASLARQLGGVETIAVPRLRPRDLRELDPVDYVLERPRSRYAESLRELLAVLISRARERPARLVLVTSALPGEGKSTVTLALGRLAASEGLRVLVVDADLRRPGLHARMGLEPGPGLGELLEGEVRLEEILQQDPRSGAALLPAAPRLVRPTRLFASEALDALLAELGARYDLVLFDSAPLVAVADTRILAASLDGILLVAQWRKTGRALVAQALELLGPASARILAATLNFVDQLEYARYGYGDAELAKRRLAAYYAE